MGIIKELQGPVPSLNMRHEMFGRENNNADIITADCLPCHGSRRPGPRLQICNYIGNGLLSVSRGLGHTFYLVE